MEQSSLVSLICSHYQFINNSLYLGDFPSFVLSKAKPKMGGKAVLLLGLKGVAECSFVQ